MALTATIYNFDVQLSDVDRGVYETLAIKAAQHPSESEEYLVARVLAYCLEYQEGILFSKGLAEPDEPAIAVRDLTGTITTWIEIGAPDAARLHKASKAAPRVVVYSHKDPERLVAQLAGERIHKRDDIRVVGIDRALIAWSIARLDRRTSMDVSVSDGHIYVTIDGETQGAELTLHSLFE